jgi:DNA polymerase III subunit gamma/tau
MTYVVTARRWRPQVFADLVGQEHISRTLSNAIRANRVAHAFLFTGLRGVGKTTAARILAKALNCEQGPSPEPCNACTNCREITEGRSVDVLEIDGASNTGVDDVREIIENVRYRPAKSAYKIYIIDEVHMLSNNAFNALLKTLEEPPPHVKFVFATTDPQKLPATVQSRCQRYDFRRIPLGLVVERLRTIADEQELKISDRILFTLAREGEGSMRDAQSLLDQIAAGADGAVSDEDALAALGIADRSVVYEVGAAIIARDAPRALEALDGVHRLGCDMRRLTRDLLEHFRNLTVAHVSDGKLLPELPVEEVETLRDQARGIAPADADRCFRVLLQTDDEVGRSAYPKLVLEMALLRLASMEPLVPVDELLQRLETLAGNAGRAGGASGGGSVRAATAAPRGAAARAPSGARTGSRPSPRGGAPADAADVDDASDAAAEPAVDLDALFASGARDGGVRPAGQPGAAAAGAELIGAAAWSGFCEFVRQKAPPLAAHLAACHGGALRDDVLDIEAPAGFRANYLQDATRSADMEELAAEFFGRRVRARVSVRARAEEEAAAAAGEPSQSERAATAMRHPAVRAALEILDGELAEVRQRRPREGGGA